jgi:hypothetical protein
MKFFLAGTPAGGRLAPPTADDLEALRRRAMAEALANHKIEKGQIHVS